MLTVFVVVLPHSFVITTEYIPTESPDALAVPSPAPGLGIQSYVNDVPPETVTAAVPLDPNLQLTSVTVVLVTDRVDENALQLTPLVTAPGAIQFEDAPLSAKLMSVAVLLLPLASARAVKPELFCESYP